MIGIRRLLLLFLILLTPVCSIQSSIGSNYSIIYRDSNEQIEPINNDLIAEGLNEGKLWSSISGLPGDITSKPVIDNTYEGSDEQVAFIGTSAGLLRINLEFGFIYWFLNTPGAVIDITSLNDVTGDNIKDVLIIIYTKKLNNTEMINGDTGEIIWSFRPKTSVWSESLGYTESQTLSWDSNQIDDITSDSYNDVIISSYNTIYALDSIDGNIIWKSEAENDIWTICSSNFDINQDNINEVALGSQKGEMKLLSGLTGELLWQIQATTPKQFSDEQGGIITIDQSVYEIRQFGDINSDTFSDFIITTEEGIVSLINAVNGEIIDQIKAFSQIGQQGFEYYGNPDFHNVKINQVNNLHNYDFLAFGSSSGTITNNSLTFINYQNNELIINWTTTNLEIENVREIATIHCENYTKMIIPAISSGSNFEYSVNVYCLENSSFIESWSIPIFSSKREFEINYGSSSSITHPFTSNYALAVEDYYGTIQNEVLLILPEDGLYLLDGNNGTIHWQITSTSTEKMDVFNDLNFDGVNEIIRKKLFYPDNWNNRRFSYQGLEIIDGNNGSVIWNHYMPVYDQLIFGGGYTELIIGDDINEDTVPEIWLAQSESESQENDLMNLSKVKLLDGRNGSIIWESLPADPENIYSKEQLKIVSIAPIFDQNLDGKQDILVACQRSYIYCLSGLDGSNLWNITRETGFSDPNFRDWIPYRSMLVNVGKQFGGNNDCLLVIGDNTIKLINASNFQLEYWSFYNTVGWLNEEEFIIHNDLENDYPYLLISRNSNQEQSTLFINLKNGSIIYQLNQDLNQLTLNLFTKDFNDDLIKDHLVFVPYDVDKNFQQGYYILSGLDGEIISYYNPSKPGYESTYWIMEQITRLGIENFIDFIDYNNDGTFELVFAWSLGRHNDEDKNQGIVLEIIDVSNQIAEEIDQELLIPLIEDEFSNPPLFPSLFMKNIGDITNNEKDDLLFTIIEPDNSLKSIIYDLEEGIISKEIVGLVKEVILTTQLNETMDNSILFMDIEGRIHALNPHFDLEIVELDVQQRQNGEFLISWSTSALNYISEVYINGTIVQTTFDNEAIVTMSPGEHLVTVSITDRNGISAFNTISVVNTRSGGLFILWIVIAVIIIAFTGIKLYRRYKPKEVLSDFGPRVN